MVEKEVKVKVTTESDVKDVEDLESKLEELQSKKLQLQIESDTAELEDVTNRIEELEQKRVDIYMGADDGEIEEVEAELEELQAKQLDLEIKVASGELEQAQTAMDGLEQSTENASSALEAMANIDIANSLSQWGSQAESFAQELDNIAISSEQLAIQTGMTDAEMTGMLNNITNATFPRDEALMYVQSLDQIGVSAQNLGASASGLDRINDAFHMGAPAVNKLGQELSVLGVDMNNVSSSFNALAYANANTVGGMENFSKFLTRYDSQFHELGMNVDQAAVAIAAATHKFGGGRAALTGMSEALKNANGDLSVLEQELGLTAGSLTNASQLTGQYEGQLDAMADKEGQHKTLTQQLAAALDDVTASTMGALSPFASFIGMVGNAGSFAVGINGIVQLVNSIRDLEIVSAVGGKLGVLKTAITGVGTAAWNAITAVASLGKEILIAGANALKAAAMWVVEKVQLIASTVAKYAATAASMALGVAEWFAASPILIVVVAIIALIAALWYLYNTNESVRAAIDGFIASLMGVGQAIYGSLMGAFAWLQGAWQNTVDFFTNGGTALSDAITGTFTWIYESIVAIFTGIFEWLTGTWQGIVDFFTGGGQTLWDTLTGVFTGVYDIIVGTLGGAFQWLTATWNNVVNTFMTYAPLIAQALFIMATGGIGAIVLLIANMNGMPNQIGAILQSIISRVVSWVGNLVAQFTSGAQRAVSGFLSPITGLVDSVSAELSAVYSAVMSFIQPLIDAFNALGSAASWAFSFLGLGQRSPGKIYKSMKRELEWTTSFVEDDKPGLVSAIANLGRDLVSSFNPRIGEGLSFDVNGFEANKQGTQSTGAKGNGRQIVNNLTFNLYGDMDTEERMKRFLDYVTEYLDWDNNTAGRNMEVL